MDDDNDINSNIVINIYWALTMGKIDFKLLNF